MKLKAERDKGIEPRKFRVKGKKHYKVKLSVEEEANDLANVVEVRYRLHPSFKDPVRISDDKENSFSQEIWTYGYFPIEVKAFDENGNVVKELTTQMTFD